MGFWDGVGAALDGVGVLIGVVSILLGLLALAVALFGFRALVKRLRESRDVAEKWPRATATITEVKQTRGFDGGGLVDHGVYEFTTPEGIVTTGYDIEPVVARPVVGMLLEVAYDPADTIVSFPTQRIKRRIAGWLVIFVIVEIVVFTGAGMLLWIGIDALV